MKNFLIAVAVIIVVGAGVGVGIRLAKNDDNGTQPSQPPATTSTNTQTTNQPDVKSGKVAISIADMAYGTPTITVKKGTIITWTNDDSATHTVTSDATSDQRGLDSENLEQGESFSFTFKTVGTYTYHCTFHPNMMGSVEVVN